MTGFFKLVKKTPMILALIFILLFFFPTAIIAPSESVNNSIVTAVGIDKNENDYEVTLLTFVSYPNQTYSEKYQVLTSTGSSLSEALTKAGLQLGKNISLFHTHTAVLTQNMLQEDVVSSLDYLVRVASLPQSCILLATNTNVKDFMEYIKNLNTESDINLEELSFYNANYINWNNTTINAFLDGYYSPVKCSLMSYFPLRASDIDGIPIEESMEIPEIEQTAENGSASQSSSGTENDQQSGGGGSNSEEQNKIELVNDGSVLIIKNGKQGREISREVLRGINWFNTKTTGAVLTLEDINDENFENARLVYRVNKKQIKDFVEYENGRPVYNMSLKLFVTLTEVNGDKEDLMKKHEPSYISDKVQEKVEELVKSQIRDALDILIEQKADVLGIYDKFYRNRRKETKLFLDKIGRPEDFISNVVFKVSVSIFPN